MVNRQWVVILMCVYYTNLFPDPWLRSHGNVQRNDVRVEISHKFQSSPKLELVCTRILRSESAVLLHWSGPNVTDGLVASPIEADIHVKRSSTPRVSFALMSTRLEKSSDRGMRKEPGSFFFCLPTFDWKDQSRIGHFWVWWETD